MSGKQRYHIAQRGANKGKAVICKAKGLCPYEIVFDGDPSTTFGKDYHDSYYQQHKERIKEQSSFARNLRVTKINNWMGAYFKTHPCVDCGNTDILALELDHIGDDKTADVSKLIRTSTFPKIQAEVEKCAVRCVNCHKQVTSQRRSTNFKGDGRPARAKGKAFVKSYLSLHPCADCGIADIALLEFDHDDQSQKRGNISQFFESPKLLAAEIAKCTVRCGNCHRHKTMHEQHAWRAQHCEKQSCPWT